MSWYGFIIAIGIVIAVIGSYVAAQHRGMEGDIVVDMVICCLPLAILGARLYHVIFDIAAGGEWTFSRFIGVDDGGLRGLAIYGGLLGAIAGCGIFHAWKCRKSLPVEKRVSFWQILDLGFTFMLLGQGIGRWGNIANSEGYGEVITDSIWQWKPFGMIGRDGLWHYAIPVYESVFNIIGFGLLLYIYLGRYKCFDGFSFALYSIYYGAQRTWIESIRVDDVLYMGSVRASVLVSILFIIAGVAIIVVHIIRAKRAGKKPFIFVERKKLNNDYFGYEGSKLAHPMPDIVFFKDRKKRAQKEEIYIDESGLAIRIDNSQEQPDGEQAPQKDDAATKEVPDKTKKRVVVPEEEYEDKWDD